MIPAPLVPMPHRSAVAPVGATLAISLWRGVARRLMQRCPNPAGMAIMEQANNSVHGKLAGRLAPDYSPLFGSEASQALRTRLMAALAAGDLDATKTLCRTWCKLVVRWTETHAAGGAAHTKRGVVNE